MSVDIWVDALTNDALINGISCSSEVSENQTQNPEVMARPVLELENYWNHLHSYLYDGLELHVNHSGSFYFPSQVKQMRLSAFKQHASVYHA